MFGKRKGRGPLKVLIATRSREVLEVLTRFSARWEVLEAFTTDGVYRLLKGCQLVVIEPSDLLERELSWEGLSGVLEQAGIPRVSAREFVSNPELWETRALAASGSLEHLPCRCVALTSYSGGVGKTTLTLDTARYLAKTAHVPVLAVEFGHGASAFHTLAGPDLPSVYDCVNGGSAPGKWRGVDLLPMVWELARVMPLEAFSAWLAQAKKDHVLTLIDVQYPHPLLPAAEPLVDEWLVLTTARPDAVFNAAELTENLRPSRVVLNQKGLGDGLALRGFERDVEIPFHRHAEKLDGKLGQKLISTIYPTARFERGGLR